MKPGTGERGQRLPARSQFVLPRPTWVLQLVSHVGEGGHLLLLGGVDHHHRGAQDAQQTANFPMNVQPLVQEVRGEHGTGR